MSVALRELTALRERIEELESQEQPLKKSAGVRVLDGGLNLGGDLSANKVRARSWAEFGDNSANYNPTNSTWAVGGANIVLNGETFSSIAFHDAGQRVDAIVTGGGIIYLGNNVGWGNASVRADGWVGLGAAPAANHRLHVRSAGNGRGDHPIVATNSSGANMFFSSGDGYLWANQAWTIASDVRRKRDIRPLGSSLARVLQTEFVEYRLIADGDEGQLHPGVIAQQAATPFPELVTAATHPGDEEPTLSFDYNGLWAHVGRSVQELAVEVETLLAEVTSLRGELAQLRKEAP